MRGIEIYPNTKQTKKQIQNIGGLTSKTATKCTYALSRISKYMLEAYHTKNGSNPRILIDYIKPDENGCHVHVIYMENVQDRVAYLLFDVKMEVAEDKISATCTNFSANGIERGVKNFTFTGTVAENTDHRYKHTTQFFLETIEEGDRLRRASVGISSGNQAKIYHKNIMWMDVEKVDLNLFPTLEDLEDYLNLRTRDAKAPTQYHL